MEVLSSESLGLRSRKYQRIVEAVPEAQLKTVERNIGSVVVPWDLAVSRALTAMGIRCISPIVRDYDFPGRFEPMPHQIRTCDFLACNRRAYVLLDMGLGKSMATLWTMDYLMRQGDVTSALIVCPKSVMRPVWEHELKRHFPMTSYTVLHAARAKRIELAQRPTTIHIINSDGIGVVRPELAANKYDLIVIDESTAYKNESTKRWKHMASLIRADTIVWMLTGTPTPQGPMDAYGQIKLMGNCPDLPRTRGSYQMRTMRQVTEMKWVPKEGSREYVQALMQPAIRVKKEDVLKDLPPVTYVEREVSMTADQKRHYKAVLKDMQTEAAGHKITAANAGIRLSKLVQIAAGSVYASDVDDASEKVIIDFPIKERIQATLDLIQEANAKVLVLFEHRHTMERVADAIADAGHSVARVDGGVSVKERKQILDDFQRQPKPEVICAIARTMSHGLTATAASTTIWFTPVMSNETYLQACNRMDRPGQKNHMTIAHIYGCSLEKDLYRRLTKRKEDQESLLDLYKDAIGELD